MNLVYFTHSVVSCWNHGNAHFLRGVLRDLVRRGHRVRACEPADGWSRLNLGADQGEAALARFDAAFPDIPYELYDRPDLDRLTDGADVVIAHEWTPRDIVAGLGRLRRAGAKFLLLFHDTHHRAVSDPASMPLAELASYDAVLAFGESLAEVYRRHGWGRRVFTWHEAADTTVFRPFERGARRGLVWVGNWGDEERTAELETFLFAPVAEAGVPLTVRGVRYPPAALQRLGRLGARFEGWIANVDVPVLFAGALATVHVPRRLYVERLPGIPTIRVFEALACGLPLLSAPWPDSEGLFTPGADYLAASDGAEMRRSMRDVLGDAGLRRALARHGLQTVLSRHTCRHRVDELLAMVEALTAGSGSLTAEAV